MSHIFISYSHQDSNYAHKLEDELKRRGFEVWIDDRIDYGTAWPQVIEKHIDTCAALIVILTPRSKVSRWVQNELAYATNLPKPIFPLLLAGDYWFSVASLQGVDVRDGGLPTPDFYDRLRKVLNAESAPAASPPTTKPAGSRPLWVWVVGSVLLVAVVGVALLVARPGLRWPTLYTATPPAMSTKTLIRTSVSAKPPTMTPRSVPIATVAPSSTPTVTATFSPQPASTQTATPTSTSTDTPTLPPTFTPTATATPTVTSTPTETLTPTPSPTPGPEGLPEDINLQNYDFGGIREQRIPGWYWRAVDDYNDSDVQFDPEKHFAQPIISKAVDPARMISGETLQVDTFHSLKFRVYVFQVVEVVPRVVLRFQVAAVAYCEKGKMKVRTGIDPNGSFGCEQAEWGTELLVDQTSGEVHPKSPNVRAGEAGQVTICIFAEPEKRGPNQLAFFDNAWLVMNPHESPQ